MIKKITIISILAVFSAMAVIPAFAQTGANTSTSTVPMVTQTTGVNPAVPGTVLRTGTSTPSTLSANAEQLKLIREQAEKERKAKIEAAIAAWHAADVACMQGAVDTRDTAIIAALDAYHVSVKAALEARKTALKAAWAITDWKARNAALKTAWTDYTTAARTARKTLESARKAAWKAFASTSKTCGKGVSDEGVSEGKDGQL